MTRKKSFATEKRWRDLVKRQSTSGLSVRRFCLENGVGENSFYSWRRKFQRQDEASGAVVKNAEAQKTGPFEFVPLQLIEQAGSVDVVHPLGFQLRLHGHVDPEMLNQIFDVIERRGAQ